MRVLGCGGCWCSSNPACVQKQADRHANTRINEGGGRGWPYLARRLGSSRFSGGFASVCWTIATREKLQMLPRRTDVAQADRVQEAAEAAAGPRAEQRGGGGSSLGRRSSAPAAARRCSQNSFIFHYNQLTTSTFCGSCSHVTRLKLPKCLHVSTSFPFLEASPQTLIGPVRLNRSKSFRSWDHLQTGSFMYQQWSPLEAGSGGFCSFGLIGHLK